MAKKDILLFIICSLIPFQFSLKAIASKGSVGSCKLIGGNEKVLRTFRVGENSAEINNSEGTLDVELSGDVSSKRGDRSIFSSVEVGGVTGASFRPNKLLKNDAIQANLIVEVNEGNQQVAIVGLNRDENNNTIVSPVKLKLTKIGDITVNGITVVTFPRTITLPLDSPNLTTLINIIENGQDGELNIDDGIENGQVTLKCKFQNLPYIETSN